MRPQGLRRTIYHGHVPPARDRQLSKGYPRVTLRASRGDRNNILYTLTIFNSLKANIEIMC